MDEESAQVVMKDDEVWTESEIRLVRSVSVVTEEDRRDARDTLEEVVIREVVTAPDVWETEDVRTGEVVGKELGMNTDVFVAVTVEGSTAVPDDDPCETPDLVRVRVRLSSVTAIGDDTTTGVPVVLSGVSAV